MMYIVCLSVQESLSLYLFDQSFDFLYACCKPQTIKAWKWTRCDRCLDLPTLPSTVLAFTSHVQLAKHISTPATSIKSVAHANVRGL